MAIQTIVFDLGGVLIDLNREQAVRRFESMGVLDAEQLIDPYEQKDIFLEVENGLLNAEGFRQKLSQHAGRELTMQQITDAWMAFIIDVPQYKLDYLLELRRQYKVFVLSNTNPFIMAQWARTPAFSPAGRPLTDYCDKIYASYEIGLTKPNPLIFEYMIADATLKPADTLFVDDGPRNVEVATTLGFQTYLSQNMEDWRPALNRILLAAK